MVLAEDDPINQAFLKAYNDELAALGSNVLISNASIDCPAGAIEILDQHGHHVGFVPNTVEPQELAAFMLILRSQDGV